MDTFFSCHNLWCGEIRVILLAVVLCLGLCWMIYSRHTARLGSLMMGRNNFITHHFLLLAQPPPPSLRGIIFTSVSETLRPTTPPHHPPHCDRCVVNGERAMCVIKRNYCRFHLWLKWTDTISQFPTEVGNWLILFVHFSGVVKFWFIATVTAFHRRSSSKCLERVFDDSPDGRGVSEKRKW